MKSILLIIFLLPLTVIGQSLGEGKWVYDTTGGVYKPDTLYLTEPLYISNYDTIPCIMLVSDSTLQNNNKVVWIKGWEVRRRISLLESQIEYLDIIKNKLNKNIIVWMSKNN